jgi:hypothetical protein
MIKRRKNAKIPDWPKEKLEKDLEKFYRRLKKEFKLALKWLFFYRYKDRMDAMLHILDVIALGFIAWRVFSR